MQREIAFSNNYTPCIKFRTDRGVIVSISYPLETDDPPVVIYDDYRTTMRDRADIYTTSSRLRVRAYIQVAVFAVVDIHQRGVLSSARYPGSWSSQVLSKFCTPKSSEYCTAYTAFRLGAGLLSVKARSEICLVASNDRSLF